MVRRLLVSAVVTALVVAAVVAIATRGHTTITAARLERSLPETFARLYAQRARLQGKPAISFDDLAPRAQCMRIGAGSSADGPGGDWACLMSWQDPAVPMPAEGWGRFELNVHSNACYTAVGPSKLIGLLTISDAGGHDVTNPVSEFDGCFDPHADGSPTGVSFVSLLSITSPSLTPGQGRIQPEITCSLGTGRCTGVVTAAVGRRTLGTVSYDLPDGQGGALSFPTPPPGTDAVTLVVRPSSGRGPADPVVVPLLPSTG